MNSGDISWQFHVATMVRLNDGKWVVIDPILGRLVSAEHWHKEFAQENSTGDLRAYITEANKFGGSAGRYDPKQLGLRLDVHRDFYKNFFTDLQAWFKFYSDDKALSKFLGVEIPKRPNSKDSVIEKEQKRKENEERLKKKIQDYYDNMS
ncbi:MAG: hypothetical protein L6Q37_00790, partial [Bdellovibrionaceae bacterium]|nr:hypothetical protein [Pseudobdellovibrionaceae bacterium]